jgi:hypothetical protein
MSSWDLLTLDENKKSSWDILASGDSTDEALNAGADPKTLSWAKSQLGKKEYENYCQLFARTAAGTESKGGSAIEAWNNQKSQGFPMLENAKPGNLVYFNGGQYGHAGVYSGDNKFISATPWGVEENDINDWQKRTGQQLLGNLPQ